MIAAVFLSLLGLPVYAAIVDIKFDDKGRFEHSGSIPAGKFVEVCGTIVAGSKIGWSFEAAVPVDFNIHYHVGEKVEYPEKVAGIDKRRGMLTASSTQDYCWMWKSTAPGPVQLKLELRRTASAP